LASSDNDKTVTAAEAVATARRLLGEAIPPRWKLFVLSFVCMLGVAGFTAALAYSTRLIVNEVFVADDAGAAVGIAFLVMGVAFAKSVFQYANSVIAVMLNRSIATEYQKLVFRKVIAKDVWHFSGKHAAQQMAQVRLFGEATGKSVIGLTNSFVVDALTVIALVIVMIVQDPLMSLFSSVMFPLVFLLVATLSRRIRAAATAETELTGAFFAIGAEAFEGIKTLKSYQLEEKSARKFEDAVTALQNRLLGIARITSATAPIMETLGGIIIGLFVMYAAWQTLTQGKTPGEFTAFITAFLMAYQPAQRVSKVWVELQKTLVQVGRMYALLEQPSRRLDEGTGTLDGAAPSIVFEDVSFEYRRDMPALRHVSFEIEAGERVAIVGRSGAGKSTLIDLVMRFYDPTEGRVMIGGADLREVTEVSVRESTAFISQDVFLFDGTIRENIRDGYPDATDAEIEEAARRAQLESFLETLPDGLDSPVGPHGSSLSGGQKQRVGIARALAKKAKVYIFDEATSALDVENERRIMQTLVDELKDVTVLFVTHRPSTLGYVDRVMMLDGGALVAFDRPDRLALENDRYRTLFDLAMQEEADADDAPDDPDRQEA